MLSLRVFLGVSVGLSALLLGCQHRMIYFPQPYGKTLALRLRTGALKIEYSTRQGRQCAFYLPPAGGAPERVWVTFGGNGALALDWTDLLAKNPNKRDGFLLVDYPGYGSCEGSPSVESIGESSLAAAAALEKRLGGVQVKWNVLGHSIGCAAALQFAASHPVERVVLVAPFTSLREMARKVVGVPFCYLLRGNFDNRARLAELAQRPQPPRVTIFHGSEDEIIPVEMGRTLAREFAPLVTFHEVAGANHNFIVAEAWTEILQAMNQ